MSSLRKEVKWMGFFFFSFCLMMNLTNAFIWWYCILIEGREYMFPLCSLNDQYGIVKNGILSTGWMDRWVDRWMGWWTDEWVCILPTTNDYRAIYISSKADVEEKHNFLYYGRREKEILCCLLISLTLMFPTLISHAWMSVSQRKIIIFCMNT